MMKLILNESQFNILEKRIVEGDNIPDLRYFTNEDFIEVFINVFRPWVKKTHGDDVGQYPLSYLIKKYLNEFGKYVDPDYYEGYGQTSTKMVKIGREIIEKGISTLSTLRPEEKFTEKYARVFNIIINNLKLPDFIKLSITENNSYDVNITFKVDFPKMLMSTLNNPRNTNQYQQEFKTAIEVLMGKTVGGNPEFGELKISFMTQFEGVDEWVKNVWNKVLKKEIKKIGGDNIHSFRVEITNGLVNIKIRFSSYTGWSTKNKIGQSAKEYLEKKLYNLHCFNIEY